MPSKKDKERIGPIKNKKRNVIKTIYIILFIVMAGAAVFVFLNRDFQGASLNIETEEVMRIGDRFNISVTFENRLNEEIKEATVSLFLPEGVYFADGRGDLRRAIQIKNILPGGFKRESFVVIAEEFEEYKIFKAEAEYLPLSLGSPLRTYKESKIKMGHWLSLEIKAPEKIISGQNFEWILSYENKTNREWLIDLKGDIPEKMDTNFLDREIKISAKEKGEKSFTGMAIMEEGTNFYIKITAKGSIEEKEYSLKEAQAEILVSPSPLSVSIISNKDRGHPLQTGEEVIYTMLLRNNSDKTIKDIQITTALKGEMIENNSIAAEGFINRESKEIIWNKNNFPDLADIASGQTISINFSLKTKENYPIKRSDDRNFMVEASVKAESSTSLDYLNIPRIISVSSISKRVAGKIEIAAKALHRDALSGVINEGQFPPMANNFTEYSVHWNIRNYSTDMSSIQVSAKIPPGVEFVRQIKAENGEIAFDAENSKIYWKIPKLLATTGVLDGPVSAIFQIRATPKNEHIGSYMTILENTHISARDNFTDANFFYVTDVLTTKLENDATVRSGEGIVR